MSLAITPSPTSVAIGGSTQFVGSGGTGPYVFSVLSGEGSVDPSTGVFTALSHTGVAVVRVTDSLLDTADSVITIFSALTVFCDIIKTEMNLADDQVYLWDQKINIPPDSRLYIAVGIISCKPFGSARDLDYDSTPGIIETLSTNWQATLSVNIFSRGPDARDRKEEVVLALKSIFSIQQQEAYAFLIAPITSSFVNLSTIEGAAIPYRFNISLNMQYKIEKTKAVGYYDQFTVPPSQILVNP